jgi:Tfp pilus assembly protein PilF
VKTSRLSRLLVLPLVLAGACSQAPRHRPLIVIGWDGADWQLLDELMSRGKMPELAALLREGRAGVLRTIHPPLSPIVWTTMMTGRSPLDHRVFDFTQFDPATRVREPIGSGERRVPAVWTIASAAGRKVAVFGMWATYPAEPVNGVIVSDRLMSFQNGAHPGDARAVYPESRAGWARDALARAGDAAGEAALSAYAPELTRNARLADGLRRVLVETAVYDELAATWFDEQRPDLTILYVQGTDAIGHLFAPYRPPRMRGIAETDVARWGGVVDRYYADADLRLGAWRRRARATGAVLLLVSDHGFYWGEGRPEASGSATAATAGLWHRDEGIYALSAPGLVLPEAARGHGEVAQVAPSILALLGIPAGRSMPAALAGLEAAALPVVDYAAPDREPDATGAPADAAAASEAVANLRTLGYIGAAEPDRAPALPGSSTRTAGSFGNEGLILLEAERIAEAKTAFLRALEVDPRHAASLWNLAQLLSREGDAAADATLLRALAAGSVDAARRVSDRARLRMQSGDCRGALDDARALAKADPASAVAPAAEALALLCLGDRAGAGSALRRSLALDPDQPEVARALNSLR